MKLTEREKKVLTQVFKNTYPGGGESCDDIVGLSTLQYLLIKDGFEIPLKSLKGVLGSLEKKELIYCNGKDNPGKFEEAGPREYCLTDKAVQTEFNT